MGIIQTGPGSPLAFSSASGGKIRAFNNISAGPPTLVLPANPSRQSLTFHNPGTIDVFVYPAADATGVPLNPNNNSLGGCFRVYANGATTMITGECQQAWYAFSVTGNLNPFTTMESNV